MLRRIMITVMALAATFALAGSPANAGGGGSLFIFEQVNFGTPLWSVDVGNTACIEIASVATFSEARSADNQTPANSPDSRWLLVYDAAGCSSSALVDVVPPDSQDAWFGPDENDPLVATHYKVSLTA